MAYANQADIQIAAGGSVRLREISDQENTGSINSTVVDRAIADADAKVDSYASMRFAELVDAGLLPLARAKALASREAVFLMKVWIGQDSEVDRNDAEDRRLELERLAQGLQRPGRAMPGSSPANKSAVVDRDPNGTGMGRKGWEGI